MTPEQQLARNIALIDELRSGSESHVVEFKHNNDNPELIGKLCSALSNAARIAKKDVAYLLWGVEDDTKAVIGTTFDPSTKKVGNQVFQMWLSKMLNPSIAFSFNTVSHPDGTVILLEIPAASPMPVEFKNTAYVRIDSATPPLTENPHLFQKLVENIKPYAWELGIAKAFITSDDVLSLLDHTAYFHLTKQPLPDNRALILEKLEAERLITRDVGKRWNITNLGAILFAYNLEKFESSLSRKAIRFTQYEGNNRAATVVRRIRATQKVWLAP